MKRTIILSCIAFISLNISAQYEIEDKIDNTCTPVKNQQNTGTCWSFATTSFIESELIRMGKGDVNLSEMFNVRKVYEDKALNYVLRQGKANFSQGSLAHDVIKTIDNYGVVPEEAYTGLQEGYLIHDHGELSQSLKMYLDGVIKSGKPSPSWMDATNNILDAYLGKVPEKFNYKGKDYTPKTFANELGVNAGDYVNFTSFSHHPFNDYFILEIPDNYSNQSYFNVTLDELMQIINNALEKGYTISWDGDVSEKGFSQARGLAILPDNYEKGELFEKYLEEVEVTQEKRQDNFLDYSTTDDHLMHLFGMAKDKQGNVYYKIKNSWGEAGAYKGYLYMSEAYLKMKTVGITLHRGGVPKSILEKM